jgi:hypothetical protein
MPIPAFDSILNVLPPHLGDPRQPADLSPYQCTMEELCDRFATSARRKEILEGLLKLRKELFRRGIKGFHWIDGSFLEDIESHEVRDPGDIDIITFVSEPIDLLALSAIVPRTDPLLNRTHTKATYSVDHFLIGLGHPPHLLVDQSRYWYGLFSHRRDGVWKGMLKVGLADANDDAAATVVLGGKP